MPFGVVACMHPVCSVMKLKYRGCESERLFGCRAKGATLPYANELDLLTHEGSGASFILTRR
jgi:hypothetical protein